MNADVLVGRFRAFLLFLVCAMCVGVIAELALTGHTSTPVQLVPFILCGASMVAVAVVWFRPTRETIWAFRVFMIVVALGGFLGMWEHWASNLALAQEVNAARANAAPLAAALLGGNPALAPGALGVIALAAMAATYAHPATRRPD